MPKMNKNNMGGDPPSGPIRKLLDREPIWRRVINKADKKASDIRNTPGKAIKNAAPKMKNRNIGGGVGIGMVGAAIVKVAKDYAPVDTSVSIVNTEQAHNGTLYTVNVDSPLSNVAEAEAFFESASGFTSILTDEYNIQDVNVVKTRLVRDTYEVKVFVHD